MKANPFTANEVKLLANIAVIYSHCTFVIDLKSANAHSVT